MDLLRLPAWWWIINKNYCHLRGSQGLMSSASLMATSPSPKKSMSKTATSITCQTCDSTVTQAPGSRRTICPHCGNFYDPEAARIPPQPPRAPKLPRPGQEGHSSQNYNRKYNKDRLPKLAKDVSCCVSEWFWVVFIFVSKIYKWAL
jgi:hypothetical protein